MIAVKLNGEKFHCPSSWQEITVRQYIRVVKEWDRDKDIADRSYFKLFNILTDGAYTKYENTSENDITILDCVGWVITQEFAFDKKLPKVLDICGKAIDIPQHPAELSIGQNIHLRRDYIEKSEIIDENIAIATAIYLQPLIDNSRFNINRAIALSKEIEKMPVCLIYPIGFFLLRRAMKFGMPSASLWSRIKTSLRQKLKRMLPPWQNRAV
jgi:hypothetical protein